MQRRTALTALAASLALVAAPSAEAKRRKVRRRNSGDVQTEASLDPLSLNVATRSAPAAVGDEDVVIVQGDGAVTLPDPTTFAGRVIFVTTASPNAFVTVENLASAPCAVVSDGTQWVRLVSHN
jgi:hypothetical protein